MDAEIAEVEALNPEIAAKLKTAYAASIAAHDGTKASLAEAEKARKALDKDAKKFKADLDEVSKGTGEAASKAQKERDDEKARADKLAADNVSLQLRYEAREKLGVPTGKWGKRALDAFLAEHGGKITLDGDGEYVGLDNAVSAFKKAEPEWWRTSEAEPEAASKKPAGTRSGAGPTPAKVTMQAKEDDDPDWGIKAFGPNKNAKKETKK
jgi:hypothetical protein